MENQREKVNRQNIVKIHTTFKMIQILQSVSYRSKFEERYWCFCTHTHTYPHSKASNISLYLFLYMKKYFNLGFMMFYLVLGHNLM